MSSRRSGRRAAAESVPECPICGQAFPSPVRNTVATRNPRRSTLPVLTCCLILDAFDCVGYHRTNQRHCDPEAYEKILVKHMTKCSASPPLEAARASLPKASLKPAPCAETELGRAVLCPICNKELSFSVRRDGLHSLSCCQELGVSHLVCFAHVHNFSVVMRFTASPL